MLKDKTVFSVEQVQSARVCEGHIGKVEAGCTGQGLGTQEGPQMLGRGIC